jgi:hypothetical protein
VYGFVWLDKVSGMVQFFAFGTELIALHNAMVLQKIQQEASKLPLGRLQGPHEVSGKGSSVHRRHIARDGPLPRLSCHGGFVIYSGSLVFFGVLAQFIVYLLGKYAPAMKKSWRPVHRSLMLVTWALFFVHLNGPYSIWIPII